MCSVGAAGYCWGGKYHFRCTVLHYLLSSNLKVWPTDKCVLDHNLAKVAVELSKAYLIEAAVLLHPTFVTVDDMKGHASILCIRRWTYSVPLLMKI